MATLELPESLAKHEIAGPTDWSNWVIKGKLVAGAYPGHQNEKDHQQVITQIVQQGQINGMKM